MLAVNPAAPPPHTSSSSRRDSVQSSRLYRNMSRTIRLHIIRAAGYVVYSHSPPPDRLEASWEDSSIICESKWWTRLCVKLPVWVKTGLRLLLIDCSVSSVLDGCQTVLNNIAFLTSPPSTSKIRFGRSFGWRHRGGLLDVGRSSMALFFVTEQ